MRIRHVLILLSVLAVGCGKSANTSDLKNYVDGVLSTPNGQIEPIPTFKPYELFSYDASHLRSPFMLPEAIEQEKKKISIDSGMKPDLDRAKEYLEQFDLPSLQMVGNLRRPEQEMWALIKDPRGNVVRLKVGEYLGKNHGKVTSIEEGVVNITELVPNGIGAWIERPRAMVIQEKVGE